MNEVIKKKTITVVWRVCNPDNYEPCGRCDDDIFSETFPSKKDAEAFIAEVKATKRPTRIELVETTKKTTIVYKQ